MFDVSERLAPLEGLTKGPKAYTTVQCGPGLEDHTELNSDLVYGTGEHLHRNFTFQQYIQ
jgi:hypothetical protein